VRTKRNASALWWASLGLVLAGVTVLYAAGLSPEPTGGDAGEIATAVARLGVIHPTGYPLYTLLGHAWIVGFAGRPFFALEAMNVALAVLALAAVAGAVRELVIVLRGPGPAQGAGIVAALALGTSSALFGQVRIVEVYTLSVALVAAVLYCLCRFERTREPAVLAWCGVPLGLSVAHHATLVFGLAAAGLYLLARLPRAFVACWPGHAGEPARRVLPAWLGCGSAGLALYATLPLANATTSAIGWGGIDDFASLLQHASGQLYLGYLAPDPAQVLSRAAALPAQALGVLTPIGAPLALLGAVGLALRAPALLAALLLQLALGTAHALSFAVGDYATYLLPGWVILTVLAGAGLGALLARLPAVLAVASLGVAGAGLFALALPRGAELAAATPSVAPYVSAVERVVPPGAVLLVARDDFVFPLWYAQHVEGRLRDVAVVNVFMLSIPWYRDGYLRTHHPASCDPLMAVRDPLCTSFGGRVRLSREDPSTWLALGDAIDRPEEGGPSERAVRRFEQEVRAHRIASAHVDERLVFERNVFTYSTEGRIGRRWDGPAFDRPSADFALVNRGEVNQLVRAQRVLGPDPCAHDRLAKLPLSEPGPAPRDASGPDWRASDRPVLVAASRVRPSVAGEPGRELEIEWFERFSFDPRRRDHRGRRLRHDVKVCLFGPDGARTDLQAIPSGDEPLTRLRWPAGALVRPGHYTAQACSAGELRGRAPGSSPCSAAVLEIEFDQPTTIPR
jgi:hypothetical protein